MNKKIIYTIVIAVAVLVFFWLNSSLRCGGLLQWVTRCSIEIPSNTNGIDQDLEGLDVNNLDTEFQQVDQELDTL